MFYECRKSKSDMDEHLKKLYIKAFMEITSDMPKEPDKVSLWEMINEG